MPGKFVTQVDLLADEAEGNSVDDQARYLDAMRRFSGDPRMVSQVFASLTERGITPTAEHWNLLLDAQVTAGDTHAAEATITQMLGAGVPVNDEQLFDIGVTFARRGDLNRAIHQFDALHQRSARPGPKHAPAVFQAFVSAKRFPAARAVLRDMVQRGESIAADAYTPVLRDALQRRAVKDTEALIAMMLKQGHVPGADLANDLVVMVCHAADANRAAELVELLIARNVTFTDRVYATILRGLLHTNATGRAETFITTLRSHGVTLTSFIQNTVVAARLAQNDADGAYQALETLWNDGMLATGENLHAVLTRSAADGQSRRAQTCLSAALLSATPVTSDVMHTVVNAALADDDVDGAVAIVYDALYGNVSLDRRVLRDITQALLKRRRLRTALRVLGDAKHAGVVSARSYGAVLIYVLQHKRTAAARKLMAFFATHRIRLNTADATQVLRLFAREVSRADALRVLAQLRDQKVYADEPTYRELLWECARAGDAANAQLVYDVLGEAGIAREESHDKALAWATGTTPRRLDATPESSDSAAQSNTSTAPTPADRTTDAAGDETANRLSDAPQSAPTPTPDTPDVPLTPPPASTPPDGAAQP